MPTTRPNALAGRAPITETVTEIAHAGVLFSIVYTDYAVDVARLLDGTYLVAWTDGVGNEWHQRVADLAGAYCWLAALERCAQSRWQRTISQDRVAVQGAFRALLDDVTSEADEDATPAPGRVTP